jgi:hypothetical protein
MGPRWNRWRQGRDFWGYVIAGTIVLGTLVLAVVLPGTVRLWRIFNPSPVLSLPDLTGCTRVEIEYGPSTFDFFFRRSDSKALLNPDEIQHLKSLDPIVLNDLESIAAIAHEIALASDPMPLSRRRTAHRFIQVTCYRNAERLSSFVTRDGRIVETENGVTFERPGIGHTLIRLIRPVQPFRQQIACAGRLSAIRRMFNLLPGEGRTYPQPSEWCDVFVRDPRQPTRSITRRPVLAEPINGPFMCPNMQEGRCHYAINPHCEPNSPPETVLLFETEAGWNQHDGPELFSFDNHDPRGGCVLFNDGPVKFIRTEAELGALRWE